MPLSSEEIDQPPGIMVTPWGELPAPFYPSSENSDCRCTSWVFILERAGPDLYCNFTARKSVSFRIGNRRELAENLILISFQAKFRRDSVSIREKTVNGGGAMTSLYDIIV